MLKIPKKCSNEKKKQHRQQKSILQMKHMQNHTFYLLEVKKKRAIEKEKQNQNQIKKKHKKEKAIIIFKLSERNMLSSLKKNEIKRLFMSYIIERRLIIPLK